MKDIKDKVSEPCFFRVSPNQVKHIKERFQQSGMKSFSAFLRQQVVCGLHLQFDNNEYRMILKAIQKSAANINQIDSVVKSSESINRKNMSELKYKINEIWNVHRNIQSHLYDLGAISF